MQNVISYIYIVSFSTYTEYFIKILMGLSAYTCILTGMHYPFPPHLYTHSTHTIKILESVWYPTIWSIAPMTIPNLSWKFHQNLSMPSSVVSLKLQTAQQMKYQLEIVTC